MSKQDAKIIVTHDGEIIGSYDTLSDYSIAAGYAVQVFEEGLISDSIVENGGVLTISGGEAGGTDVYADGMLDCQAGILTGTTLLNASHLELSGTAVKTVSIGGDMTLQDGSLAVDVIVTGAGNVLVNKGGYLEAVTIYAGDLTLDGGSAAGVEIAMGQMTVKNHGVSSDVYVSENTASLLVQTGGAVANLTVDGANVEVKDTAAVFNTELWSYEAVTSGGARTLYSSTMTLRAGAWHFGTLFIDSRSTLVAEDGSFIDFTLEGVTPGKTALLNDFTRISGAPNFTMTVSEEQAAGIYSLAGNAGAFDAAVTLLCDDFGTMTMSVGDTAVYHNSVYALALNDSTLSATVTDFAMSGSAEHLSWGDINGAESCTLQIASAKSTLSLEVDTLDVDLLGLSNGDYAWRVRNAAEADNWQTGAVFSQVEAPEGPQKLEAETNGATDLFFAKADGVWGGDYCAENVFTGERRSMKGMARITDVFAGSEDASILVLCGDGNVAEKGAALFLDDIYSAMPSREGSGTRAVVKEDARERISRIQEIYAGSGDDLVDLTSARFHCDNSIAVYGGAGNDILWGGGNGCRLFGDEGDDSLTGTAGNDILVGGSGNDVIQCLGGEDILCFGANWGDDLVVQQAGGKATLWFAQGDERFWDAESMVYSDGASSVRVAGSVTVADITLRFGDDGSGVYSRLCGQGAFLAQ